MSDYSENHLLPPNCPFDEANEPNNLVFYRFGNSKSPNIENFASQGAKDMVEKPDEVDECIWFALSIWESVAAALASRPSSKKHVLMELTLNENDGKVLRTRGPGHYSWWRTNDFDITSVNIIKITNNEQHS